MDKAIAHQGEAIDPQKPSHRNLWRDLLISVAAIFFILFLAVLFIPTLDGPNSHRAAREAVAVGKLRRIVTLQNDYAISHPNNGFACQLALLRPTEARREDYDSDAFLLAEDRAGYRIALIGCESKPNGVITRYRVTAVPLEPGKSGVRAFCTDQTGALWYDASGSAEDCLALRRTIE
jgi:hypothetical protein